MRHSLRNLLISNYSVYIAAGLFSPVYALFVLSIHGNAFDAGATNAAFYVTAGILMFVLSGRKDQRRMLVAGFLIEAMSSIMFLAVNNISMMYAVQIIHAIGVSLWVPALKATYAGLEDQGREAREWSWFEGGDHVIIGLAALAGGGIITLLSFHVTFVAMAIAQTVAAVAAWFIEPKRSAS